MNTICFSEKAALNHVLLIRQELFYTVEVIYEFCAFILRSRVNNRMQTMFKFNVVLKYLSGCEIAIGYNHCVLTKTFYKLLQKRIRVRENV